MSTSPARGSIGLSIAPSIPDCAVVISDPPQNDHTNISINSIPIVRRARLGKSMAREMMLHPQNNTSAGPDQPTNASFKAPLVDVKIECTDEEQLIKDIKLEEIDEDVVCVVASRIQNIHFDGIETKLKCDGDNKTMKLPSIDDQSPTITPPRKPKILELNRSTTKKSPSSSYKSLIKPSEPKPYLCKNDAKRSSKAPRKFRFLIRGSSAHHYHPGVQQRKIIINGKHKNLLVNTTNVATRPLMAASVLKRRPAAKKPFLPISQASGDLTTRPDLPTAVVAPLPVATTISCATTKAVGDVPPSSIEALTRKRDMQVETNQLTTEAAVVVQVVPPQPPTVEKCTFMSRLDLTIDQVAKGYVSDQEHLVKKRLMTNSKLSEGRSKSESKKPRRDRSKSAKSNRRTKTSKRETKNCIEMAQHLTVATVAKTNDAKCKDVDMDTISVEPSTVDVPYIKSNISTSFTDTNNYQHNNNNNINNNNNNNIEVAPYKEPVAIVCSATPASVTAAATKSSSTKKPKSRGARFSNKKRHRSTATTKTAQNREENIILPRHTSLTAAPRWSNGWRWQGSAEQGKVFLNVSLHIFVHNSSINYSLVYSLILER